MYWGYLCSALSYFLAKYFFTFRKGGSDPPTQTSQYNFVWKWLYIEFKWMKNSIHVFIILRTLLYFSKYTYRYMSNNLSFTLKLSMNHFYWVFLFIFYQKALRKDLKMLFNMWQILIHEYINKGIWLNIFFTYAIERKFSQY